MSLYFRKEEMHSLFCNVNGCFGKILMKNTLLLWITLGAPPFLPAAWEVFKMGRSRERFWLERKFTKIFALSLLWAVRSSLRFCLWIDNMPPFPLSLVWCVSCTDGWNHPLPKSRGDHEIASKPVLNQNRLFIFFINLIFPAFNLLF